MMKIPSLTRDHTCVRGMNWRCDIPPSAINSLLVALPNRGYLQHPSPDAIPTLRSPEGHHILFVRTTGRVQIRVNYTVPEPLRRFAAETIFTTLVRTLQQITT